MRYIRLPELLNRLGVSRATAYRWEGDGILPPRRQIGPNAVGWLESEIDEWMNRRPVLGDARTSDQNQASRSERDTPSKSGSTPQAGYK